MINTISEGQKEFFNETVASMVRNPYSGWTRLWVEPADPTLIDPFASENASNDAGKAWQRQPIFFFSPTRLAPWQRLGVRLRGARTRRACLLFLTRAPCPVLSRQVEMPCPRHGWNHTQFVKVYPNRWVQRLVKGVFSDFTLAGQECRCSECKQEHQRSS